MELFTARPRRARWLTPVGVLFVLSTLLGGFVDGTLEASAAPADPAPSAPDATVDGRVVVRFEPGAAAMERRTARSRAHGSLVRRIEPLDVQVWSVPAATQAAVVERLGRNPNVVWAELDHVVAVDSTPVVPNDPWWDYQWALRQVHAPEAWSSTKGSDVTVAILDTGVAPVAELDDKLVPGRNVVGGSADTSDGHGHGTASAGVAAAETNNGTGVAAAGWATSIMPVKVMDGSTGTTSDLAAGIVWAADHGADVISMSVSGASGTSSLRDAVRHAASAGSLMVAAAGNNGDANPRYPAAYDEVIGVAGSDSTDTRYSWSNYGSWVDVAAPGFNRSLTRDGGVTSFAGTSSATPLVAGVAALGASTGATATEVRQALLSTSAPLSWVAHGRIDAEAAVLALLGTGPAPDPVSAPSNAAPVAGLAVTCIDLACDLDASGSSDSDGTIASLEWDLGDGSTTRGATVHHEYATAGTYTVTLTVTDDDGATDVAHAQVDVTAPAAPAPAPAPVGLSVELRPTAEVVSGPTWNALVRVTASRDGTSVTGATVTGVWSAGARGTATCTTDAVGSCVVRVDGVHNRTKSVTFTLTRLEGETLDGLTTLVAR